jgi:peptide/nickel transport system permease protein
MVHPEGSTDVVVDLEAAEAGARPPRAAGWLSPHLWVLRRLLLGVLTLLVVSIVVFAATEALPSDPARAILGKSATPQLLRALRAQLGLNRPLRTQYVSWLGHLIRGDLGTSLAGRVPVTSLLGSAALNSFSLLLVVMILAVPLGIFIGATTAIRRDRLVDRGALTTSLILTAVPDFVLGLLLVILFATTVFHLLPAVALIPPGSLPFAYPAEMALPVLTLVIYILPYLSRLVRAATIDVLESDYVTMARLKGMPERVVLLRHALPNALIPVIQGSALMTTYLLGGIVVVEFVFGYPGLGSLLTSAITEHDLPVIQAVTLIFAGSVVFFNLVADMLTIYLTPRLRTRPR